MKTSEKKLNFKSWYDSVIDPMRKSDHEHWFCGEINDENIKLDSNFVFSRADSSAHVAIVGMTGSGKTSTLAHLCVATAAAYPKAQWFFGCGKPDAGLAPLANHLSSYPLAMIDNKNEDVAIQFTNIINAVCKEYIKRQQAWVKARELGYNPSNYLDLRKIAIENDLPELYFEKCYLVIDELRAYWDISCGDPGKYVNKKGSIPYMLNRLLAEGGQYGISLILTAQDYKYTTFPTKMRGNLTTQFIHKQKIQNCQFVEVHDASELTPGEYFLRSSGTRVAPLIKMKMPFVEGNLDQILKKLGLKRRVHRSWNYNLTHNRGVDIGFENMETLQKDDILGIIDKATNTIDYLRSENKDLKKKLSDLGTQEGCDTKKEEYLTRRLKDADEEAQQALLSSARKTEIIRELEKELAKAKGR